MREQRRLEKIFALIDEYHGEWPMPIFLRNYFHRHREMGSSDRRLALELVYCWFRLGKSLPEMERQVRMAVALFICSDQDSLLRTYLLQTFTDLVRHDIKMSLEDKLKLISKTYPDFNLADIFPFKEITSKELDFISFATSILQQPYLWLRPKKTELITGILMKNNIPFINLNGSFGITKSTNLLNIPGLNKDWFEIQDYSSQLTGKYFKPVAGDSWYDCCAASGGKSLLLHTLMPDISLAVSDNRERILFNLKERFQRNGIEKYELILADLEKATPSVLLNGQFDGIIADVPCTGSGTWSRSPEQISLFDIGTIKSYTERQKKIIHHVAPLLKKDKPLLYITCSVFEAENEALTEWIAATYNFELEESALIQGSAMHADTMFVARLIKK